MKKFNGAIREITKLTSAIASDNFKYFESLVSKLKTDKTTAEKVYEALLQCYLFCGFPPVIEALKIFRKHFPEFHKSKSEYQITRFKKIGETNCKLIYKKNYKKLIENMNSYSPDLKDWMIIEGYGKVLGRPGLSFLEREFINVSILCTRYYKSQLHSHLKGCINLGASKSDLNELFDSIGITVGAKNKAKALKLLDHITAEQDSN
jgi:4-carboxymuconolactone decarboxylase